MKRKTAGDYFVIALLVLAPFLGGGIWLLAAGHNKAEIIGGVVMLGIGGTLAAYLMFRILFLILQRLARGIAPGIAPPRIDLVLASEHAAPGAQIVGRVDVTQSGRVRKLEVTLRCRDSTRSYEGASWMSSPSTLATGTLAARRSYSFSLPLPPDAPPTFSAGIGSIWWEVDAHCDVIGTDVHVAKRIKVAAPAGVS